MVSTIVAKDVLSEMFATGKSAVEIVDEKGWRQISDADSLEAIIDGVIAENPGPVADFQKGKTKAIGFWSVR